MGALPERRPGVASPVVPVHVGIIMDGNGRWAAGRGLPRAMGHRAGAEATRRVIEAAAEAGVRWLTLFAFSSENWRRPASEVLELTGLLRHYLRHEVSQLVRDGVRLRVVGDRERFGVETAAEIERAERLTADGQRLNLNIALSYGARAEIAAAARAIAREAAAGRLDAASVDEALVERHLATRDMPDPDLIIRTSGEQRLSNFLLWQSAYAELVFTDVLWPDFDARHFTAALSEFARRERRYGGACVV
ncbi:polyprenyl diphosphate synthase [Roseomonas elaeocarpi]|uniref:Isoprenyl transferase n=1 Tax=Roseomonas elaeocarpi TaxID=907779 RepID=A0ABV6JR35_9PROT